jgi:integrase
VASARVEDFTPHAARHDFCSRLANSGVPPHVVQQLAGHSTIVIIGKYYLHVADDALRAAVERV